MMLGSYLLVDLVLHFVDLLYMIQWQWGPFLLCRRVVLGTVFSWTWVAKQVIIDWSLLLA